ncbi:MAG: hypothetical protein ACLRFK_03160 [Alphaproteobacteria bacterium]
MAFDTEKYIIDLAKQLNLKNMDDARRARLADLKKKSVVTSKQAKWDPDAEIPGIDFAEDGKYKYNDNPIPEFTEITTFKTRLEGIASLNNNKDVTDFLANYEKIPKLPDIETKFNELTDVVTEIKTDAALRVKPNVKKFTDLVDGITPFPTKMEDLADVKKSFDEFRLLIQSEPQIAQMAETERFLTDLPNIPTIKDLTALYAELDSVAKKLETDTTLAAQPDVDSFLNDFNTLTAANRPDNKLLDDLYNKLSVILRDMSSDKELKENTEVQKFLGEFYGKNKAVEEFTSAGFSGTEPTEISDYIATNKGPLSTALKIKESDLEHLQNKLSSNKYTTDPKALRILNDFLDNVYNWNTQGGTRLLPQNDFPACFGTPAGMDWDNISALITKANKPQKPTPEQLKQFAKQHKSLFDKLIKNEKLLEKFTSKDSEGDVSKWINKGIDKSNYKTGDHALSPKYTDRKTTVWKRAEKKLKDFYVDTLGKMQQKHTRHKYKTDARHIVGELIKKGVKPTDGTEKILNTLDAINANLPNPVQKQAKWIKETLSDLSGNDFFKDALRNGKQMNKLVSHIIVKAAHENTKDAREAAEVALEMLAVMRYTTTTSSVRDKLKETEFKLLSDPNMSFNKGNNFMQGVTSAIDKTLKFGMMLAFEVGNLAKNTINQHGLRFGKGQKGAGETIQKSEFFKDPERRHTMEYLMGFWNFVNSSANTKDYNPLTKHSNQQKKADAKDEEKTVVTLDGHTETYDNKTAQNKRFLEYLARNKIGRDA